MQLQTTIRAHIFYHRAERRKIMEIANLVIAVLSLIVNIIMLTKVNQIAQNAMQSDGHSNKNANQVVKGKYNQSRIQQ